MLVKLLVAGFFTCFLTAGTQNQSPGTGAPTMACATGEEYFQTDAAIGENKWYCTATNTWTQIKPGGSGAIPSGAILLIVSGNCPSGFTEETSLSGKSLLGTLAANADVGSTGGADSITPAGTVSQPTFTGDALGAHQHGAGTYATSAHTGTAVNAHSGTAVSAHTGTAVSDHGSHTHTYTDVVNHVHVQNVNTSANGGNVGYGYDASTNTSAATGYSTGNPTGGVATGTTAGPSATLTHSVTQPAAHTVTQPNDHVVTQPAAHTMSGSSESVAAGTPAGTVSQPTFTGAQFDNRSAYVKVIFCRKD